VVIDEDGFAPPGTVPPCMAPGTGEKPGAVIARVGLNDMGMDYETESWVDLRVWRRLTFLFNFFEEKEQLIGHIPFRLLALSLEKVVK
jgi:hypothetical protein